MTDGSGTATTPMADLLPGRLLLAVFALWAVLGLTLDPGLAQDAIPTVVAGEMVSSNPEAIYVDSRTGGIFEVRPAFAERFCDLYVVEPCEQHAFAFLGMPGLLPVAALASAGGPDTGVQLVRLMGVASAVAGMSILWSRLVDRHRSAPWAVLAAALLVSPVVLFCVGMGQTSTVLFLSTVLGVTASHVRGTAVRALAWVAAVLVKASPLALAAVLVVQRRWKLLGTGLAALAVLHLVAVAMGGWELLGWFWGGTRAIAGGAVEEPNSGGYEAVLAHLPGGGLSDGSSVQLAWAIRLVAAGLAAVGFFRIRDQDVQWAFAWSVLVALLPISWWHYSVVSFGAIAVAVSRMSRPERWVWLPAAFLLAGLPMSIAINRAYNHPLPHAVLMAAAAVAVFLLGTRPAERDPEPDPVGLAVESLR